MVERDKSLEPVKGQETSVDEWDIPTGAPEDFGFPAEATLQQRQCWQNQERFLDVYRQCGRIGDAAKAVGLTRYAVERWQRNDVYAFKKRIQVAGDEFLEKLEAEADRRAVEGTDHPVIFKGVITGTYKEYSDNLLMFRMKKLDPTYRENYNPNAGDQPVQVTRITVVLNHGGGQQESQTRMVEAPNYEVLPGPDAETDAEGEEKG